ncbi:sugar ABC transporter permease [Paenibacillus sp. TRM 82003]|nr:sugar ABC transporter permease [Paenibacillus sp. TRM 82003]
MRGSRFWEGIRPYLLVAPAMTGILLFVMYPAGYLVYLSLFKYNLMNRTKSTFIGLDNFRLLLTREDFYKALTNTAAYTVGVVAATILLSLVLAVWLNRKRRMNAFVQMGIFTPHIVSIVSIALLWMWLMEPNVGLLNFLLKSLGLPTSSWLQSSRTALTSVMLVSVWQGVGYFTLIIIAALQSIPQSIYEAAELDNAGKLKVFFKITLPMISPQLFFILVILTIGSFKVFETVQVMTGGGPNDATTTMVYYIYSFRTTNIGFAAASGVVLMGFVGILTLVYFRLLSKKVHYQ